MMKEWSTSRKVTLASIVAVALVYAVLAWQRRWMSDDGMIVVRTVRQFLDGGGPVFNMMERTEANTSTLWTYVLVVFAFITRLRIEYLAVFLGLLLSVGGVLVGMDATRRMLRARGSTAPIVPAGALVVIGVFPFWDYATSGLETGLCFAWIACCWWLLVTAERPKLAAFVFGLGPLVRPDLGIGSISFFVVFWLLHRPVSWRATIKLAAIGMALPVAYEIFRMGYYGTLVPLPALAKSATEAEWARGLNYLRDYSHPYKVWIPFAVLATLAAYLLRNRTFSRRDVILIAAPLATGFVNSIYVLRVGGDFMHARMFLTPTFALLLPAFVLPLRRYTVGAIGALSVWAVAFAVMRGDGKSYVTKKHIEDERHGYAQWTKRKNPIHSRVFVRADRPASKLAADALKNGERVFISQLGFKGPPLAPNVPASLVYAAGRLGTGGAVAPLDEHVADTLGLANPIGARITPTLPGHTGHEKVLPWAWHFADYGDPAHDDAFIEQTPGYAIRAARRAMQCGELKELLESVRAPMSASRFWKNLTGSIRRTRIVIPSDPVEAEIKFCKLTNKPYVTASNVYPFECWSKYNLVDGVRESTTQACGHTTRARPDNVPEWVELRWTQTRPIGTVTLYPATDGGLFPLDFKIQVWLDGKWVDRIVQTNFQNKPGGPHPFTWSPADTTDRIRLYVTKMRPFNASEFSFQLNEIEVAP